MMNRQMTFDRGKTYIMGILNVTPDSFSDGGLYTDRDRAMMRVSQMIDEGADIIDVGGESTRPGFMEVPESEERDRTCSIIEEICRSFDVPVSIDTYKDTVAAAALEAGAFMVNDIWGLREEFEDVEGVKRRMDMSRTVKEHDAYIVLMHNSRSPYKTDAAEENYMGKLNRELLYHAGLAEKAGIGKDRVILDPGLGFGKTYEENLLILKHLKALKETGYPLLLGASRKSFIGRATGTEPDDRLAGTLLTTALARSAGFNIVRVHDIKENRQILDVMREIDKVE
ncbi:MAG: dihydropteroate synthase [Lachnospiraceae bacterium]|nr:dihydropteroate synthase [Lachnospiraceae bacterium]